MNEFTMGDIEEVSVNGIKMWKLGKTLFLTKEDVITEVKKSRCNWDALSVLYNRDFDIIGAISKAGCINGLKF